MLFSTSPLCSEVYLKACTFSEHQLSFVCFLIVSSRTLVEATRILLSKNQLLVMVYTLQRPLGVSRFSSVCVRANYKCPNIYVGGIRVCK